MREIKNVCVYYRVSTDDQDTANQKPDVERYCLHRGWTISKVYEDTGCGADESRKYMNEMMNDIRQGHYQGMVVWSYDRFARSVIHLHQTLKELERLGVAFVSTRENYDTSTPEGEAMFGFSAVMAQMERRRIIVRTRAALARLKAQGVRLGRPTLPEEKIQEILAVSHLSHRQIAERCGVGKGTVQRVLERTKNVPQKRELFPTEEVLDFVRT